MHLGINMMTLAAFGAPVERLLGVRRFVLFYLSAGIVAGFVHVVLFPNSLDPVIGASGAISGVFGAVLMLMRYVGNLPSLLPIAGIWIALNVFFGMFGGTPGAGGEPVAWAAHVGGFVYGLLAIRFFAPRRVHRRGCRGRPACPAPPLSRRQRRRAGAVLRRPAGRSTGRAISPAGRR